MKKRSVALQMALLLALSFSPKLFSQNIAINITGNRPDTSAMLDISSTTQGFLMPRMTGTQVASIYMPATGLLVFNTSSDIFQVNTGTPVSPVWNVLGTTQSGWSITGNSGTGTSNFLGTTDDEPLTFKINNSLAGFINRSSANTFLGYTAGAAITSGFNNTFFGYESGQNNTSGSFNTTTGELSGSALTTGSGNSFFGTQAGFTVTTGSHNTGIGYQALYGGTPLTGSNNIGVGYLSGLFLSSGNNNTLVGPSAGFSIYNGNNNIALGNSALYSCSTANQNIALGNNAGYNAASDSNVFIGNNAGYNTNSGAGIFIGNKAAYTNFTGTGLLVLGDYADVTKDGLTNATAIGYTTKVAKSNSLVLGDTTTGSAVNVGIGVRNPIKRLHIDAATIGNPGTKDSLKIDNLATASSAINKAVLAIDSTTGYVSKQSVASLGANSFWGLNGNTGTNSASNFIGTTDNMDLIFKRGNTQSGLIDSTLYNTSFGFSALNSSATGGYNTAVGFQALKANIIGTGNTAIGYTAGKTNTTGTNITLLGNTADVATNGLTNATAIGANAQVDQSNSIILGSISGVNGATASTNVGIGTTTPTAALDDSGTFKMGAKGTINKNIISFAGTLSGTGIPGLGGDVDLTVTIPAVDEPTTTQATVEVSPAFDLPDGVSIASARLSATNTVKIRFANTNITAATLSSTSVYITINEF